MYAEDYESGLFEFQKVLEIIHERDVANLNSDEALIAEEENCEILYNIGLCHLESNKTHSLQIFSDLSKILNSKHRGQMLFLCALIEITLNNTDSAEALLKDAFRCDQDSIKPFLSNEVTTILPLNTNNEFASKFEYILLPFSNQPLIKIRPALSLPRVKLPSMNLERIETRAKDYFTISKVTPKPEAPWLNRVRGSIQFTELIVDIETEPNDESDEETKPSPQKDSNSDSTFPTRHIKSMMPLRHNSSSSVQVLEDTEKLVDSLERAEERYSIDEKDHAPDEVLKRIKAICKPV